MDVPTNIDSGQQLEIEIRGTYTRTQHTDLGKDGRSRLGEDQAQVVAKIPTDWGRPMIESYDMEGDIRATPVPEAVTQDEGLWRVAVTFRVLDDVASPTTGYPVMTFSIQAPVSSEAETYTLISRENVNDMLGALGNYRVSVGGNVPPDLEFLAPGNGVHYADESYTIRWTDDDPDDNLDLASVNTACAGCSVPSNGTLVNNGDGTFDYTPDPDYNGLDSFVYEICDTIGACDTAVVNVTVDPVADPPLASQEVLHPEQYLDPSRGGPLLFLWLEAERIAPSSECTATGANTFGEFGLKIWAQERGVRLPMQGS